MRASMPFNRPRKVLLSLRQVYSLLQMHLNLGLLKYCSRVRFLLFTIFSFSLPASVGVMGSIQGRLSASVRSWYCVSRKKVRGAIESGLRTVLSQLAGICSLIFLLISIFISSSCLIAVSSASRSVKHQSTSSVLFLISLQKIQRMTPPILWSTITIFVAYNQQLIRDYQFPIFYYLLIQLSPEMDKQIPFEDQLSINIKSRDYKCPCGKTYLSYAALFTHIKQKHEGKAPGKISKPPSQYEKRGRPPVKPKVEKKENEGRSQTEHVDPEPAFPPETEEERQRRERSAERIIAEIGDFLLQMPEQELNKAHLNEIQVFSQMNVYLNTCMGPAIFIQGNICVADGFFQFARSVCSRISWRVFEPFYLLFMLFLQFIIDSQNNRKLLTECNMDIFCEYINDFIENHLHDMAEYYELENLWVVRKENSIRIFFNFFNWCMHKRYVSYRINMAQEEKGKVEGKEEGVKVE